MKILFIYPVPPMGQTTTGYHFGIGYCSAVLKKEGYETSLLRLDDIDPEKIKNKINYFKPDLIGISSTSDQFDLAKKIIKFINNNFSLPIIIGGVHATVSPEDAINVDGILGICRGEGEFVLLDVVKAIENNKPIDQIDNLWVKKDGAIIKNPIRPLIEDLDKLPFCDREIFNYNSLISKTSDGAEFIAGRGCPFSCTFCINHVLQQLYKGKGKYLRLRSVDNLLEEIEQVNKKNNIDKITFHDDTFTLNKNWLNEFCEKYPQKFKIPFRCNVRVDTVDEKILSVLKKAGCEQLWVGVESGDEYLRNSILKKNISEDKIVSAFKLIKKYGIKSRAFNMIGVPYETPETAQKTINLNTKINADMKCLTIFRPYPGTELHNLCIEKGWISNRKVHGYYEDSMLNQPSISKEDIYFYHKLYFYQMYLPFLVPLMKKLYSIKIFNLSLFSITQPKQFFYFVNYLRKKFH